jgi:hypothetical protein
VLVAVAAREEPVGERLVAVGAVDEAVAFVDMPVDGPELVAGAAVAAVVEVEDG